MPVRCYNVTLFHVRYSLRNRFVLVPSCNDRGTCYFEGGSFGCNCDTGTNNWPKYSGDNCQNVVNFCSTYGITCSGHGTCSHAAHANDYTCTCDRGWNNNPLWEGHDCETAIDFCSRHSVICSNQGSCNHAAGAHDYVCTCVTGWDDRDAWEGHNCETYINFCTRYASELVCSHHGDCTDMVGDYECVCDHPGYTGRNCDVITDWCSAEQENEDCNHHGECLQSYDNIFWTCSCHAGYTDNDCTNEGVIGNTCDCDDQLCLGGVYCHNNGICG